MVVTCCGHDAQEYGRARSQLFYKPLNIHYNDYGIEIQPSKHRSSYTHTNEPLIDLLKGMWMRLREKYLEGLCMK